MMHTVRRFGERLRRRFLQVIGRPDTSPWVLAPRRRARNTYVDFVFALDYCTPNSAMLKMVHDAFSTYGLSVLLVNSKNVEQATRWVKSGRLRPHLYLDLSSRPGDIFEQLLLTAAEHGIYTIRRPEDDQWTTKSTAHRRMLDAGLPLPPSVIFTPTDPDRDLTPEERAQVGELCVIKPAFGEAGKGVKLRQAPTKAAIAAARDFNRKDDWLVQKMVSWTRCGDRPAYFRGYNIAGSRSLLWWSIERKGYDLLSWDDVRRYELLPVFDIIGRIADLTGMDFFSTEVAAVADSGPNRFVLIDYCNDQCDIDPEGGATGSPPHTWAKWVYRRFAEMTLRLKHGIPLPQDGAICLPEQTHPAPTVSELERPTNIPAKSATTAA